jgi:tetratricopeptide (TPR) repeat protein
MTKPQEMPPPSNFSNQIMQIIGRMGKAIQGAFQNASIFARITATVGLAGGIIGATLGGLQIYQKARETRETQEKVGMYLATGDQFAATLEYDQAVKQYEKAVEADKRNMEARRRIVTTMRDKLLWSSSSRGDEEVDTALTWLYQIRALYPKFKDDVRLLIDEALILKSAERDQNAIRVLERARQLSPEDPAVLAELGCLYMYCAYNMREQRLKQQIDKLELIRHALKSQPNNALYHYYLARSFSNVEQYTEALREYTQAAKLANDQNVTSVHIRRDALHGLWYIFSDELNVKGEGVLTSRIDMPLEERASILEYLITKDPSPNPNGTYDPLEVAPDPYVKLFFIYRRLGKLDQAARMLKTVLGEDKKQWRKEETGGGFAVRLKAYAIVLEESGSDPKTLANVHNILRHGCY